MWSGFVESIDASKLKSFVPVRIVHGSWYQKGFPFKLQRVGLGVKSYSLRLVSCSHHRNVSRCRVASRNSHDIFRFSIVSFCSAVASRDVHVSYFIANLTSRCTPTAHAVSVCVQLVPRYFRTQTATTCTAGKRGVRQK